MPGFRIDFSRVQQLDTNSKVYAGAKLFVYENTTTTPVALFSDLSISNSAENPIVADTSGRFPVRYVATDDRLTFEFRTVGGALIWSDDDMEPVPSTDAALQVDANLGDLDDPEAARANLGLGDVAEVGFDGLATLSDPAPDADFALVYDVSVGAWKKIALVNLRPREVLIIAVGDESTALTTGTNKVTLRAPYGITLLTSPLGVRASLTAASSSGAVTVDVNVNGASILSTKLTIDQGEKTSVTAAVAAVISAASIPDDAEITFDIDAHGANAAGLKVTLIGYRS